ncbi:AMP-binding protein, partial [bacterium]|nr:AMP-binding protein [bacterium]
AKVVQANAMISFEQAFLLCQEEPDLRNVPIKIVAGPHKGSYSASLEQLQTYPVSNDIQCVSGEETALITFTTGSSGIPKGANRTHSFLASQHYALSKCIPYHPSDIDLPAFPNFSWNNLAMGVTTIIPCIDIGRPSEKDPLLLVAQMLCAKVTCATLSPSMVVEVAKFCAEKGVKLPMVRRLITGGAPISNDTLSLLKNAVPNSEIWVLYCSPEVEPIAHIEANDILFPKHSGIESGEGVNVGHLADGLECKFIKIYKGIVQLKNDDWTPIEIPVGNVGELVVAGLHVCKSYYNDPEAVRKTKIIESTGKVWHRTGDVAYLDKQENLWLVGRVHNVISRAGQLLFPVKVEILLKKHPCVLQAAFVGIEDKKLGEKAYALVTISEKNQPNFLKVLEEIKVILEENKVQYDYLGIIESIPMDPRHQSKVEYALLREKILAPKSGFITLTKRESD